MAIKGYKITPAVLNRLEKARKAIKPKIRNPNNLKPNDSKYRGRMKIFRKSHTPYRNKCRKNNYSKSRPSLRRNRPWSPYELQYLAVWTNAWSDRKIARDLDRSVQAIQQKRYQLKKEE